MRQGRQELCNGLLITTGLRSLEAMALIEQSTYFSYKDITQNG